MEAIFGARKAVGKSAATGQNINIRASSAINHCIAVFIKNAIDR